MPCERGGGVVTIGGEGNAKGLSQSVVGRQISIRQSRCRRATLILQDADSLAVSAELFSLIVVLATFLWLACARLRTQRATRSGAEVGMQADVRGVSCEGIHPGSMSWLSSSFLGGGVIQFLRLPKTMVKTWTLQALEEASAERGGCRMVGAVRMCFRNVLESFLCCCSKNFVRLYRDINFVA